MSDNDFAALMENSGGWNEICSAVNSGRHPQSVAALVPPAGQEYFVECYARIMLEDDRAWSDGRHPDLIYAGTPDKAPSIEECRKLNEEMSLHPVSAKRRLSVIWAADKLSLEAENSLLKLTEEPPANACILFVMEENKLLPTIRSRVWTINIDFPEECLNASKPPQTPAEWAEWFGRNSSGKKGEFDAACLEIQGWINYYIEQGEFAKASNAELLVKMAKQKNTSLSMLQDMAFAVLQGDVACEQIFGSLR
ncbi:MAG: hypothetical protein KBS54_06810 [Synergistaceae bacterium]|nr:hypothetical protein [Candidatus Equadaptatus faecalis]